MTTTAQKIALLTYHDKFFGQTRKPWTSLNVEKMKQVLESHGFSVHLHEFHEIMNRPEIVKGSLVFYTFHQKVNRRQYITDLIHILNDGQQILVPSYDLLKCHEDKGFQELYKKKIGLPSLKAVYLSSAREVPHYNFDYPVVLKTVDQSNAKGVFLARDQQELISRIGRLEKAPFGLSLDLFRRKYFRKKKKYAEYPDYDNRTDYTEYRDYVLKERNFIVQEFVPDMKYDYRVLVLYDIFFVTRRMNRDNDFRASGAKNFRFDFEAPKSLLDYAADVYRHFDSPYLSLDIAERGEKYDVLEYQALHFGINVVKKNRGYYRLESGKWTFTEAKVDFETVMARALAQYIRNRIRT